MRKRTWPYGTRYEVDIIVARDSAIAVVAPSIDEAFLLTGHGIHPLPAEGTQGVIEFTEGGPTGGYWKLLLPEGPPQPTAQTP